MWSMGVVLYAMTCARLPFNEEDMKALSTNEYQGKVKFSKRVSRGMSISPKRNDFMLNWLKRMKFNCQCVIYSNWLPMDVLLRGSKTLKPSCRAHGSPVNKSSHYPKGT